MCGEVEAPVKSRWNGLKSENASTKLVGKRDFWHDRLVGAVPGLPNRGETVMGHFPHSKADPAAAAARHLKNQNSTSLSPVDGKIKRKAGEIAK